MGTGQQRPAEGWVVMQARRLGFGRNPLRRRVDRIESLLLVGVVLLGLLAIPAAAALGTTVRHRSEATAAAQRAVLHPVQAKTLEAAAGGIGAAPGQVLSRVRVQWQDAHGVLHEGRVDVVVGTKQGSDVEVWLDRSGAVAKPPRPPGDSAALGGAVGLTAVMLTWLVLYWSFLLARLPLNRRRSDDWAREWKQVAQRWNNNQH